MTRVDSRSRFALAVVLGIAVVSAGCVGVTDGGPDGTSEPAAAFEEDLESADPPSTVTATLEVAIESDGDRETFTEPVWLRAGGASRIGDVDAGSEFVEVDDGDRHWEYDVTNETVSVSDSNATGTDYIAYTYAELDRTVEEYAITTVEETTVDGREAYRVVLDPPADETIERSISIAIGDTEYVVPLETSEVDASTDADRVELWTDREHLFPLKYCAEADDYELTIRYTDVAFDEEIDDDRFAFEPPESATVERDSQQESFID